MQLLEVEAGRSGVSVAAFMERSAGWWLTEADPTRPSHPVPHFLAVELSPDLWFALERSAEEQDTPLELVVLQAAMCYAAQRSR